MFICLYCTVQLPGASLASVEVALTDAETLWYIRAAHCLRSQFLPKGGTFSEKNNAKRCTQNHTQTLELYSLDYIFATYLMLNHSCPPALETHKHQKYPLVQPCLSLSILSLYHWSCHSWKPISQQMSPFY